MASPSFSSEITYGIGVSARDSSATIYFPIKTKRFIFEPMINIAYYDEDWTGASVARESEGTQYRIGAGVFMYNELLKNTELIYGARLGYLNEDSDSKYTSGSSVEYIKYDRSGYFIAPTLGLEYNFTDHISLGLYVSLEYSFLDGDNEQVHDEDSEKIDLETTSFSTETDIFLKFYF
jgi:hypothetical protein